MTPFSIPAESIPGCMFDANLMIPGQIHDKLSWHQPNFPGIWSRNGQMTLKVKTNDPHFQYQLTVSQDACLVQIWWFQVKSLMKLSCHQPHFPRILNQNGQMTLKVMLNDPPFSIPAERITRCIFGANLVVLAQIHYKLSHINKANLRDLKAATGL